MRANVAATAVAVMARTAVNALSTGDPVTSSMSKVWPGSNPMETYQYYDSVPLCKPAKLEAQPMTFGQIMRGDRLVTSPFRFNFQQNAKEQLVCVENLDSTKLGLLRTAVMEGYMFEMYVDDLPVIHPVGRVQTTTNNEIRYLLGTFYNFELGENDGRVVTANLTMSDYVDITDPPSDQTRDITMRMGVTWAKSQVAAEDKLLTQLKIKGAFLPSTHGLDIHWLAIINSFVLVMFVVSLLLLIVLRVVRSDLATYLRIPDEELAAGVEEETGWKLLRADVFRPPPHRMWFCACIGSGAHILLVALTMVVTGCFWPFLERGTVLSGGLFGFMLTSFISGYISANLYRRLGGEKWAWNILVTALMFVGPVFAVWSLLNTIAIFYSSTAALPFSTATVLFLCWLFVTLPLTVLGGIVGRQRAAKRMQSGTPFPCKANKLAREIPSVRWHQSPWAQVMASGFLPFSAIYIELHYIFSSLWGPNIYTMYGVLLFAVLMLMLVAATVSILLTYFHLNSEDHRWWWRSICTGGSVAMFFFIHATVYFFSNTRMTGFLQVAFFFGYSLVLAFGLFLMMGFITFAATYAFVWGIYSSIKSD